MWRAEADSITVTALLVVVLMLSACSSSSRYTPIDERSIGGRQTVKIVTSQPPPNQYRVRRGDTLYSIAFRYGLDFRQLARRNNISGRYQIYPGQLLSLKTAPARSVSVAAKSKPTKASTPVAKSTQKPATKPATSRSTTRPQTASSSKVNNVAKPAVMRTLNWRWPAAGKVIQRFSSKGKVNKGINFAGRKGDAVHAAEAGKVVYAGSGLLGYGNLVIIHHNQKYLSAYAHNSRILVKEDDMVRTGQKIAEIGNSGAARTMLHFEIRRDGHPVDPMLYLPRKR